MNLSALLEGVEYKSILGNQEHSVEEIIQISEDNRKDNVIFWCSSKYKEKAEKITAGCIILDEETLPKSPAENVTYIIVDKPRLAFQKVLTKFYLSQKVSKSGIEKSATIAENAKVSSTAYIGHNVVIEDDVTIGENTVIDSNTVIKAKTQIGDNCHIGANCTVGAVGFGYEKNEEGEFELLPHLGNVVIEDNVEVGNNTCIDRGVLGSTFLRKGSKVDNLVHIAHGVDVGCRSFVIANAMVAGSVKIGEDVWVAPSSSIINGIELGDKSVVGLGAVVVKPVEESSIVIGNPAKPLQKKK